MVSSKENAVKNFVYFCMNFNSSFIQECWKDFPDKHSWLEQKFSEVYKKRGTGVIPFFFIELDGNNQQIFSAWINENYVGFKEFHELDKVWQKNMMDKVENSWKERYIATGLKWGTKTYREKEMEFFIGAMAALGIEPASWVIMMMSGREVLQPQK